MLKSFVDSFLKMPALTKLALITVGGIASGLIILMVENPLKNNRKKLTVPNNNFEPNNSKNIIHIPKTDLFNIPDTPQAPLKPNSSIRGPNY